MRGWLLNRIVCLAAVVMALPSVASANVIYTFDYHFSGTGDSLLDRNGSAADPSLWPNGITPSSTFSGELTLEIEYDECDGELYQVGEIEVSSFRATIAGQSFVVPVGSDDVIWGSYNTVDYYEYDGAICESTFIQALLYGDNDFGQLSFCYQPDSSNVWMNLYWNGNEYSSNENQVTFYAESNMAVSTNHIVPEPATCCLLAAGGLTLLRRRKA